MRQVQKIVFWTLQLLAQEASRRGDMKVFQTKEGLLLRIRSRLLFASGRARVRLEAVPILKRIARILFRYPHPIRIRGYTDNLPIRTVRYPNNWALSTMRSVNVLVRLIRDGPIEPERISAEGFGKYYCPIASNLTVHGREMNRRVEVMIVNGAYFSKNPIRILLLP